MSNLQRKTNACYGIECFLRKHNLKVTTKTVSDITASFLKSKGLPYAKFNPKYKGLFHAGICNAETVQQHFKEFKTFVMDNYKIKYGSTLKYSLDAETITYLVYHTNNSHYQLNWMYNLVNGNIDKLKLLIYKIKNNFIYYVPSDVKEVNHILSLNSKEWFKWTDLTDDKLKSYMKYNMKADFKIDYV